VKLTYIVSGIKRSVFFEITALELAKRGYKVDYILISNLSNDFETFLDKHAFNYITIRVKSTFFYPLYVSRIVAQIKKFKPDIVHTHLASANITGLVAARLVGIKKRIYTEHSGNTKSGLTQKLFEAITYRNAAFAIANTNMVKQHLIRSGFPERKTTVISYGFDLSRFQKPDPDEVKRLTEKYNNTKKYPVIGVIARPVEWKGIQYTIRAFKEILNDFPNALLCLFNYSPQEKFAGTIDSLLNELLPIGSYIKIDFENNVFDLYQLFDVFVHVPVDDDSEAFGQVYVEALAAGIPSVFTISGIAHDFIEHNRNALIVDYKNADEIYLAVRKILANADLSSRLIRKGIEDVREHFEVENYMKRLVSFYENF
jgi:glycosyltransferase involved in cell wall biosynthesis